MELIKEKVELRKMVSDEGYVFQNVNNGGVYQTEIYLGDADSPDNYREITIEEAEKLKTPTEEQAEVIMNEENK